MAGPHVSTCTFRYRPACLVPSLQPAFRQCRSFHDFYLSRVLFYFSPQVMCCMSYLPVHPDYAAACLQPLIYAISQTSTRSYPPTPFHGLWSKLQFAPLYPQFASTGGQTRSPPQFASTSLPVPFTSAVHVDLEGVAFAMCVMHT